MMQVNDEINKQIEHITENYGKTPSAVYLTFEKYHELCEELNEANKRTFIGIPIYIGGVDKCGASGVNVKFKD